MAAADPIALASDACQRASKMYRPAVSRSRGSSRKRIPQQPTAVAGFILPTHFLFFLVCVAQQPKLPFRRGMGSAAEQCAGLKGVENALDEREGVFGPSQPFRLLSIGPALG